MIARSLLPLFALAVPVGAGQIGLYGPVTAHLKAGDVAPNIRFNKLLSAPGSAQWRPSNLRGQITILIFYLNTSRNLQTVAMWNSLVDEFAGKPAQFLFISGEEGTTLLPWLSQHSIKGWVFHDPDGQTGKAYGFEQPATVFIGTDGRIIGFGNMGFPPDARQVNAALEGRITTTRPIRTTLKAFMASGQEFLNAEPQRMPRPDENKPKFPPSYILHVSPSQSEGHSNSGGDDFWTLQGYTLKDVINEIYDVNPIRVHLLAALDDRKRYDFSLVLPEHEDREKMKDRFQQGIQDYFHVTSRHQNQLADVYVVTNSPDHKPPAMKPRTAAGMSHFRSFGVEFEVATGTDAALEEQKAISIEAIRGVEIDGTADEFCHELEFQLDRPVVNETNLQGEFEFHVESTRDAKNDFLEHLRSQLGLVITPAQRNVETIVFDFSF